MMSFSAEMLLSGSGPLFALSPIEKSCPTWDPMAAMLIPQTRRSF
jgi:hypothetical protein